MGTDKRERQKSARYQKIEAEQAAARRDKRKRGFLRGAVAIVVVVAGVFVYSTVWGDDDDGGTTTDDSSTSVPTSAPPAPPSYSNPALAEEVLARTAPHPAPPPADTAPDALEITTMIDGQGDVVVEAGDSLVVHYVGKIADGTVFDESWSTGSPFGTGGELVIGTGGVIQGWDEGLIGARIGERRRLVIGSNKAYGAQANGSIPANAPLAFEVDIVDVIKATTPPPTTAPPAP